MSHAFQPNRSSTSRDYSRSRGTDALKLAREHGVYGMVVALVAMSLGLSPVVFLFW